MENIVKKEQIIHIAFASNNYYAVLLAALLKSIIFNHQSDEPIVFYILDDNISKTNKRKIDAIVADFPSHFLKWFSTDQLIPKDIKFPIDKSAFPFTAFFRLFAPYILENEVEKLIYFDVDMIVRADVSELWNMDTQGYTLAAVVDVCKTVDCSWGGIPNYKELKIRGSANYFNSGLMIINPKRWRESNIPEKVFKVMNDNINYVNFADQYGLNVVFAENWIEIDPEWNWFATYFHPNPKNIHFLDIKPIFKSYKSQEFFKDEFFKYLDMTPYKGISLKNDYLRLFRKGIIKLRKMIIKVIG